MTLFYKTGIFAKPTDTDNQVTVNIPTTGFTPKAVILYTTGSTVAGGLTDGYQLSMGFSDGTNNHSAATASQDNVTISTSTPTQASRYMSTNDTLVAINSVGSEIFRCQVSFAVESFNVLFSVNSTTTADEIGYIALGGTDITNVKVGNFTTPAGLAAGNFSVTDVGFQPDIVFQLGTNQSAGTINGPATGGCIIFSAGRSSSEQGVSTNAIRHGLTTTTSDSARYQRNSSCYAAISQSNTTALVAEAAFVATTGTGFTVNWITPQSNVPILYLAIKGGQWKVGNFNQGTTATTQNITDVAFQPQGVMIFGTVRPTETAIQVDAKFSFGSGTSSTEQNNVVVTERDNQTLTLTEKAISSTRIIRGIGTSNVNASAATVLPEAAFVTRDSVGFTVNNTIVDGTSRMWFYVAAASTTSTTPVTGVSMKFKYNIQNLVVPQPVMKFKYNVGGRVFPYASITHRYNVLGIVQPTLRFKYDIRNTVTASLKFKYNVNIATTLVTASLKFKYNIVAPIVSSLKFRYDVEEADIFKTGYGKPLRCRIVITDYKVTKNLLIYNSFHPEDSQFKVSNVNVRLAQDSAGDFSFSIEDHSRILDTSVIGPGCKVTVRAAKTEPELTVNNPDCWLLWGQIKSMTTIRNDTGTLEYRVEGFGLQVRTNERITNFVYTAKKKSFDNPEPDPNDTSMIANNLVKRLINDTDHLPLGEPLLKDISIDDLNPTDEETGESIAVTDFIPSINEPFTEFSSVLNSLADTTGGVWGVTAAGKLYFRYETLKHSGVVIKDHSDQSVDPNTGALTLIDDPKRTAYPVGPWSYTDDITKESGFSNRFFAKIARKSQTGNNVINLANIRDEFTELFNPEGGDDQQETSPLGTGGPDITTNPSSATAGVYIKGFEGYSVPGAQPGTPEFNEGFSQLANLQRQYPTVKILAELRVLTDGTRASTVTLDQATKTEWINGITTMQNAGVTVVVRVAADPPFMDEAKTKADIDAMINNFPTIDGISLVGIDNTDETTYKTMYTNLATYIKVNKGRKFVVAVMNKVAIAYQSWLTDMNVDVFMLSTNNNLVPTSDRVRSWYSQTPVKRRGVTAYNINVNTGYTEDAVRQWINDYVDQDIAGYFDVISETDSSSFGAVPSWVGTIAAELQRIQVSGASSQVNATPTYRDLAQSFTPTTEDLSDIMLLVSKVGNPRWNDNVNPITGPYRTSDNGYPNYIHGHIETSKTLVYDEFNPQTGQVETKVTEQPSGEVIGIFGYPFADIGSQPTTIFLNNVKKITGAGRIIPGRRYWVVLFGRGQDENNTIRWHHSDNPAEDSLSGERSPGGHEVNQNWTVFNKSQSPGFALSFFDRTLDFLEASDSDSIEQFGLVESVVDLSFIDNEVIGAKYLQTIVNQAAKPKRVYDMNKITAPDKLLFPGQLISIVDEMSGHSASGSDQIDAEIVEVEYNFDAYDHPLGCFFLSIKPLGYVDFALQLWRNKLNRGEIAIPSGEDIIITPPQGGGGGGDTPPPPPEDGGGGGTTEPPDHTCPTGQHWDDVQAKCVDDAAPPPPPPTAPPDLDVTGILRTRGPFTTYQDFVAACNNAIAGDMIILGNGSYTIPSSADTTISRVGNATNPIIIRAENVGGVTLNGTHKWEFNNCSYLTWYGFTHRHDSSGTGADNAGISWHDGDHNRLARCDIDLNESARNHWVYINTSERYFKMDHCYLHGKTQEGSFINFRGTSNVPLGQGAIVEYCRLDDHTSPNNDSGEGGQFGESTEARNLFRVTFRYNFVSRCNGDGETITNKSSGNLYFNNTFSNNNSVLTLRHGDRTAVISNHFERCGLRIYGADNVIANNHITLNSNTKSPRGPFTIGIGDTTRPSSGTGYETVDNNKIVFNTIHNDTGNYSPIVSWGNTPGGSIDPANNLFRGNIITGSNGTLFDFMNSTGVGSNTFSNNIAWIQSNSSYGDITTGMADRQNPGLTKGTDGVWRITNTSSNAYGKVSTSSNPLSSTTGADADIDGETRTGRADAGADWYSAATTKPKKVITLNDVGPAATTYLGDSPTWNP